VEVEQPPLLEVVQRAAASGERLAVTYYSAGRGEKGSLTWSPDQRIVDALNDSFYASFGTVDRTEESYLVGVDISGSMTASKVNGSPNLTAAEVAAVMAMAVVRNQPSYHVVGFHHQLKDGDPLDCAQFPVVWPRPARLPAAA